MELITYQCLCEWLSVVVIGVSIVEFSECSETYTPEEFTKKVV